MLFYSYLIFFSFNCIINGDFFVSIYTLNYDFFFILDPLEQFQVVLLSSFLPFSNFSFYLLIFFIFIFLYFFSFMFSSLTNFPFLYSYSLFYLYLLTIKDLIFSTSSISFFYFYWFVILITSLLMFNISGLLPFSFTLTTHFFITFYLAFIFFVWINVVFFFRFLSSYFATFLPSGAPFLILPLLIPIELISYFARLLSLSIRLFANMMAGHTLLVILIFFLYTNLILNWLLLIPIIVIHLIYFMECGVAVLQVYVFVVLSYLYLTDTISYPSH